MMVVPLAIVIPQAVQTDFTLPFDWYTLSNVMNVVTANASIDSTLRAALTEGLVTYDRLFAIQERDCVSIYRGPFGGI